MWTLEFSQKVHKQLRKMDPAQRTVIIKWLEKNVHGTSDPRAHGKALVGDLAGIWRYRIGHYRVLVEIQDDRLVVLALSVDHRSRVYRR
ncbi:type II toxin-antitoxin system RelE/ParE family toxin [Arcanobacterium wilhelmae]|nr:type II toxin-antitoxin system RelE/ParE family toxin [Arcanobacterium wilhelmae]WFN91176.1 type II toxin-antitoxin system RelE/ParE family toxin [Arcanobacterium wilhelmae]